MHATLPDQRIAAPTTPRVPHSTVAVGLLRCGAPRLQTIRDLSREKRDTAAMSIHGTLDVDEAGELFTSVEVAAIIGCDRMTLNRRLLDGSVPGRRTATGRWVLDAAGLAVAKTVIHPQPRRRKDCLACHQIGDLLYSWDTGTVAEITPVMGIHEGNVRKHLNDLAAGGLAIRRLDGSWELTDSGTQWMIEVLKSMRPIPPDHAYDELKREVDRTG